MTIGALVECLELESENMLEKIIRIRQKREAIYLGIIFCSALLFYTIFIYRTGFAIKGETYFTLIDDAMISMRYARNLSNGFGLVWNAGKPPVEGFTNLGWTLYMALLHKAPVPESKLSLLVMSTSALLLAGNGYLSFKLSKVIDPMSRIAPLVSAIITIYYYPLVFWSLRGMEVGFATFLVYLLALLAINSSKPINIKRALAFGSIVLMAILVRFDLLFQVTLLLGYVLYDQIKQKASSISISLLLLFYLTGVVGITYFQYRYFGSGMPNTYYLKLAGTSLFERAAVGIQVLVEYAARDFLTPLFIIIAGLICFHDFRERRFFLFLALFLIQCGYSIYVGGDYAEPLMYPQVEAANRFITQGMPSVIILYSIVIDRFFQILSTKNDTVLPVNGGCSAGALAMGIGLATLVIMSGANWFKWTIHNAPLLDADIWRTQLGLHIRSNTDENAVIAVHAAGQIPYYSNRQTIDLLGKNDPVVAMGLPVTSFRPGHNKWNYEYSIMILQPDLVADEWGQLSIFLEDKHDYYRLKNGVWVRKNNTKVNVQGLGQTYR